MVRRMLVNSRKGSLMEKENTPGSMEMFMKAIFNLGLDTVLGFYQIKKGAHIKAISTMNKPPENAKSISALKTFTKDKSSMVNSMVKAD